MSSGSTEESIVEYVTLPSSEDESIPKTNEIIVAPVVKEKKLNVSFVIYVFFFLFLFCNNIKNKNNNLEGRGTAQAVWQWSAESS